MLAKTQLLGVKPELNAVLGKSVIRAAAHLGISQHQLGKILGLSAATISRLHAGSYQLDAVRKEWDLAILFVRVFRLLDPIVGDPSLARAWLNGDNLGLNARPIDLLFDAEGLVRVAHYLGAAHAR
jgi:DNA-binding XRE family transcriptional regulator